jgi:acyl carrier protein
MINHEKLVEIINDTLGLTLELSEAPLDCELKSLGIDSMDMFSVLAALETISEKKVPDEDVKALTTIKNLLDYFS